MINLLLRNKLSILIVFSILFLYLSFYLYINGKLLDQSDFPYYSLLINSLFSEKLNITPFSTIDLTSFRGKWYLNWGPGAIVYISLFKLVGLDIYDKLYTLIAGLINIGIFAFFLKQFTKYFKLKLSYSSRVFLILCFALSSPNFYLSLSGRIWFTEQVTAVLYILSSLAFLFKFLNTNKLRFFVLSAIFFDLSWITRAPLVFHIFLFLAIFYQLKHHSEIRRILFIFVVTGTVFALVFFTYNYLRFHNIFETGLKYHLGNPRYEKLLQTNKIFSVDFISFNFFYYFLNLPAVNFRSPYMLINLEGNSIFVFYPFLLLIPIYIKKYFHLIKENLMICSFALIITSEMILLLTYFATGWTQVGMRYFFDLIPLSLALIAFVIDIIPNKIKFATLSIGTICNTLGALIFFKKLI